MILYYQVQSSKNYCKSFSRYDGFAMATRGVKYKNGFLFLTDAPPCSLKAGRIPSTFYPKMLHLTCVANGFYRVAKTVGFS